MSLADTVARVRSGVIQIVFANPNREKLGGGSGFVVHGHVVTNHHVFVGYQAAAQVGVRSDDMPAGTFRFYSSQDFAGRLISGSQEQSYDYAILRLPEVIRSDTHQFTLTNPSDKRIGDAIALLGFPLEHENLTCHSGVISSFYSSGVAEVIQLDASVNAGNSGGPLIDPEAGVALGMVTRKATGLSRLFSHLRQSIHQNIQIATQQGMGGISIGGIDPIQGLVVSQNQMLLTLDEIERQANVGIGYAFSATHIMAEPSLQGG